MTIQMSLLDYTPRPYQTSPAADAAHQDHIHQRGEQYSCWKYGHAATYPFTAGWKDPSTSRDAAVAIEAFGRAEILRDKCLMMLRLPHTPKELAERLGEEITSIRPRLTELLEQNLIERTGDRRERQHVLVAV